MKNSILSINNIFQIQAPERENILGAEKCFAWRNTIAFDIFNKTDAYSRLPNSNVKATWTIIRNNSNVKKCHYLLRPRHHCSRLDKGIH